MKTLLYILLFLTSSVNLIFPQITDSLKTYNLKEVLVFGKKYLIDQTEFPVEKDNLTSVLELGGFNIIRKGGFLAQDIYADGLKRGDYTIVVDGERYHNACPMRMDAPISRINPIEVKSINLVKSSSNLQSGLGGVIEVNRSIPTENFGFSGSLSQMLGKSNETEISMLLDKFSQRISLRYIRGLPYKTDNERTFKDLYGYKENKNFQFGEASLNGIISNIKYTGSLMYSENVSFPYLQMDEIKSVVYNFSISYYDYKLYFNYTDHLMNNNLRVSNMFMETDAKNLTVGFVSNFVEVYYRHWNAQNRMNMINGTIPITNHMLPDINLFSLNLFKKMESYGFDFSGKIGVSYFNISDKGVVNFYKPIHPEANNKRVFPLIGMSISKSEQIGNSISINGMIDFASEAPEAEALFINVKRMMGKAYWSGNPNLYQPFRSTLRADLSLSNISMDLYGCYIFNYVYLTSAQVGMQKYQTYGNVNALIFGVNFHFNYKFVASKISYTYGENRSNNKPLIEILPLHITNSINFPKFYGIGLIIKHTYENAQKRTDKTLLEYSTGAWNRIDFGMTYNTNGFTISMDAENILNHNFSKHLSYVRDPFASGMRIIEPGLSYRINFRYNY
jgi:iron complex outermembrane receptor protein